MVVIRASQIILHTSLSEQELELDLLSMANVFMDSFIQKVVTFQFNFFLKRKKNIISKVIVNSMDAIVWKAFALIMQSLKD